MVDLRAAEGYRKIGRTICARNAPEEALRHLARPEDEAIRRAMRPLTPPCRGCRSRISTIHFAWIVDREYYFHGCIAVASRAYVRCEPRIVGVGQKQMATAEPAKPDDDWPVTWVERKKHRLANRDAWDRSKARQMSSGSPPNAQYNPHRYRGDQIQELEMRCIREGQLIGGDEHVRHYYMRMDHVVGMCSGDVTDCVYVEWSSDGSIHGRPISEHLLRLKGVRI